MLKARIFVCDESVEGSRLLEELLSSRGHAVETFSGAAQLLRALEEAGEEGPELVLLDSQTPGAVGLEPLRRLRAVRPGLPVVLMSAFATVRNAVEAMKLGATDYLIKPVIAEDLFALVEQVVERSRLENENRALKAEIRKRFDPGQIVFRSSAFKQVFDMARKVARSEASVLILGESGVGKELVASTIHYESLRKDNRFLTINCAALTDTLLESQLFGHVKGAFTGAVATHRGLVEEADKGTLFLDEIGDISAGLQAKLLRVLQEKEYIPVGSTRVRHSDVRFLAATNKNLEKEVAAGRFREDLLYRLNVVTLQIPPLRERREDIPLLAEFFVRKFAGHKEKGFTPEALARLQQYHWPGNVRELENVIEMAVIMAEGESIVPENLPVKVAEGTPEAFSPPSAESGMSLEDVERLYIEQVYQQTQFHKMRTSEILGISRKTLDRKLRQYQIGKGRNE